MKGKKRKGAKEPKQPNPKQPKPKPKGKPDDLRWAGPVSPQGRARKAKLKEAANSRIQFIKCYLKGFIRGRNAVKNKIVAHIRLRMGIHHKQRKLTSLAVLVLLAKCLVGPPTPGFHPAPPPPSVQPPPAQGAAPLDPLPGSLASGPAADPAQPAWQPKLQERSSSRLASRRPLPPAPVPPQPLNILDPLAAHNVQDWTAEFASPSELSGWKQIMRGPAHRQNLRPIPKAFFADPDNAAIIAKLVELDKTELLGDSNTIGHLAKQMAVSTQEMFANPALCQAMGQGSPLQVRHAQQEWGTRKQLVVFFGNASIGTRGGWGAKAVLQACRKVVERANSGKPTDRVQGKVVTVDEFRTSRVSSILNSPQPCEEELDRSKPTRLEGWKPKSQATPGKLGKWVDRDCNAALNLQRAGESKWHPLELCRWQHRGRLPAQGKEYPALGFKMLRERAPKAQAQQPVAQ
ncbi:hypothetical protein QJQ45_025524 [Haematococcus lacustris]|nr:hypothetical protein QJQ45_025524 [Haematococcus lacustris]